MKASRNIWCVILLIIPLSSGLAQDPVEHIWKQVDSINNAVQPERLSEVSSPWSFHTSLGTSYAFSRGFGSSMQVFAAPAVNYAASKRLSFHGGFMATHNMPLMPYQDEINSGIPEFSTFSVFLSSSYQLTENLVIHGTALKSLAGLPLEGPYADYNFHDLSIGATYNFGNFSIGASFHQSDRMMYSSPFGFGSSPFGTPLYW